MNPICFRTVLPGPVWVAKTPSGVEFVDRSVSLAKLRDLTGVKMDGTPAALLQVAQKVAEFKAKVAAQYGS